MTLPPDDFDALHQLLAGYFNQDYDVISGSYEGALRDAHDGFSDAARRTIVAQIDRLLALRLDEKTLRETLERLGCELFLEGWTTPGAFLTQLRNVLATGNIPAPESA
ncbi:MAG: hypothetical protein JO101_02245 [Candidatus Eremiobacteraeota bacterium]|nr:hypothetical protein [Candidatus Eremiobacteraeota bacterium]MBV8354114.1 hypothetical protein [Candidatus Eremiobacteraeota bacterium]